MKLSA
jgi:hypothetical protein